MEYTAKQKEFIDNFRKTLTFGSEKLSTVGLNISQVRHKKQLLFYMMGAMQSYSEAVLKLMEPPNVYGNAAEVLIRSMVENFININYIYSDRTYKSSKIFLIDSILDRIDFAKKYHSFWDKNPQWDLKFGDKNVPCDWDKFIFDKKNEIFKIEKKSHFRFPKKIPDLRARAEQHDLRLKKKDKLKMLNSLEKYYIFYYKYFSQITHLTMMGLERFYNSSDNRLDLDSRFEDIERIVPITFILYFVTLKFFCKQFNIFKIDDFRIYEQISKGFLK